MQNDGQNSIPTRTGNPASLWLALLVALVFHIAILLLPATKRLNFDASDSGQIEVQLTVFQPSAPPPPVKPEMVEPVAQESEPEAPVEAPVKPPEAVVDEQPPERPIEPQPPLMAATKPAPGIVRSLEQMNEVEQQQLSATILTRQFISEEPVAEQLFGRPLWPESTEPRRDFHYPIRPDLLAMLDQPMPELPFDYTPGLVRFAYDPGVRGDLQRFWDVITPEFGWKTKYGTEVRCIYVLVIVACGWK